MLADISPWFENLFSALSIITGIVLIPTTVLAVIGTLQIWRLRRSYRRRLQVLARPASRRPIALAIGIGGDVTVFVRNYLKEKQLEMEVFSITHDGIIEPKRLPKVIEECIDLKNRLSTELGPTEVHVFYRGPAALAIALGTVLNNWIPTIVYSFSEGTYVPALYLDKHTLASQ